MKWIYFTLLFLSFLAMVLFAINIFNMDETCKSREVAMIFLIPYYISLGGLYSCYKT